MPSHSKQSSWHHSVTLPVCGSALPGLLKQEAEDGAGSNVEAKKVDWTILWLQGGYFFSIEFRCCACGLCLEWFVACWLRFCSQWPTLDKPHTKPLVGQFRLQGNCTGCSVGGNQSPNNCGPTRQDWNRHQTGWSRSANNYCVIYRYGQILIIIWVGLISSARLQCDSLQHGTQVSCSSSGYTLK